MARSAIISHRTPGRIRIKIPSAKADPEFLEQARAALSALPGVIEVSSNPLTGSLLVLHLPETQLDLKAAGAGHDGISLPFVIDEPPQTASASSHRKHRRRGPRQSMVAHAVAEAVRDVDDAVRDATGNVLDLKVLLPIVAGVLGLTLIGRSRRTPIWLTLMMFAFSSFMTLHDVSEIPEELEVE